ncbi:hypothetical protein [Methylocystis sp. ATCC 49242]|uniref:hypothetical protein n=1 Tax=Methylocystis sp. ATCC 49242 TaxID=622637 RepID=UPI0001F86FAF|nr:hypothetical protein [Methylocystis sp. ATCC 49242]
MNSLTHLTAHATKRVAQRGIAPNDLELIKRIGTEVEGGYLVRQKDFQVLDRELRHLRDQAKRLVGKRVVVDGDTIVTAYHANAGKERWLLRRAERRALVS